MAESAFTTNPVGLAELLKQCQSGELQLPDFQRSWVWDEDRIKGLIASISRAFPIGAVMALEVGGDVKFKPRMIEGAGESAKEANALLLDGQQRLTSMFQVAVRQEVVKTVTPKKKKVDRWFYIDMTAALDPSVEREDAILGLPADRIIRKLGIDVSTPAGEYAARYFPVNKLLESDLWIDGFKDHFAHAPKDEMIEIRDFANRFRREVLDNFKMYQVPVITLKSTTTKEAVCMVFEKVNTGGKALDAFELVTAMYAADGHELRRDWFGDEGHQGRLERFVNTHKAHPDEPGILSEVGSTDFLHVISLFYTQDLRREAEASGRSGKELPAITGNRAALLNLPLEAYQRYEEKAEEGFTRAAQFLHTLHIFRPYDLPYQSQVIPLAAILAQLGDRWNDSSIRSRIAKWYWNGVFGELYGSTTDTRIAKDFVEVPAWVNGGDEPTTIKDSSFRADRLLTMKMRLSAAYKGMNALLMDHGAKDFRTGQKYDHTVFFDESIDIHHIFPQKWCSDAEISKDIFDSIINKTPISAKTNRMIGGHAPSYYLAKLEQDMAGSGEESRALIDLNLLSHLIDPVLLREDSFSEFMKVRQEALVKLIALATDKAVVKADAGDLEPGEIDDEA
jgi:hypothetical protein